MEHIDNQVRLRGTLLALPRFSHENHDRKFFRFTLEVSRLSGAVDLLPVVAEERLLNDMDLSGGSMLTVTGQIRTHNIRENGIRHLLIFVFAAQIICEDGEPINEVIVEGPLCKEPTYRRTPLGREICDIMLAVNRMNNKSDYIPCIAWGRNARFASSFEVGKRIQIWGRVQSRDYVKKINETESEKHTAYEVSVSKLEYAD